jgi:hypothetical protein
MRTIDVLDKNPVRVLAEVLVVSPEGCRVSLEGEPRVTLGLKKVGQCGYSRASGGSWIGVSGGDGGGSRK